ncbi:MAG: VCBS repeat-containing protein [Rhodothermales bacterium]|nr:VCBS repeat-containing protein [Rhodothermales bacterium]MBO6778070.1 VCBS repeat-containing protein [Rhodothermales bacterium]
MIALLVALFIAQPDTVVLAGVPFTLQRLDAGPGEVNMAAGDFTGDGRMDTIAVSAGSHRLTLFAGDGRGRLTRRTSVQAGRNPTSVQAVDLNGDGHLDAVIANHETSHVTLLHGDGAGGFVEAPNSPVRVDVEPHPHVARAHDIDDDGVLDLLVDDRNRGGIRVLPGLTGRSYLIDTGGDPYLGFDLADLDGNGFPDLVTPNPRTAAVAMNRGGSFSPPQAIGTLAPFGVALADLDHDGAPDLVAVSGEGSNDIEVWAGPNFSSRIARIPMSRGAKLVATGDLNGDDVDDAVVCGWSAGLLVVAGGTLTTDSLSFEGNAWGLLLADFNADGRDDLVVADGSSSRAVLYLSVTSETPAPNSGDRR